MILIEIPDNSNCAAVDLRVFHDLEPAQPVSQVRLVHDGTPPQWYDVTGWTASAQPCPAWLQKVDDSGDGVAFLLYGGEAGLRFRPSGDQEPWRSESPQQWGEPFLIVADQADIRADMAAQSRNQEPAHG